MLRLTFSIATCTLPNLLLPLLPAIFCPCFILLSRYPECGAVGAHLMYTPPFWVGVVVLGLAFLLDEGNDVGLVSGFCISSIKKAVDPDRGMGSWLFCGS